jgi:hypothetical protein
VAVLSDSSFARWFRGSKVVDDRGRPLVLYHGGPAPLRGEFRLRAARPLIYATPDEDDAAEFGDHVTRLYMRLVNPLDLREETTGLDEYPDPADVARHLRDVGVRASVDSLARMMPDVGGYSALMMVAENAAVLMPFLLDAGFDGLIGSDSFADFSRGGNDVSWLLAYVAFSSKQLHIVRGGR